MKKVRSNWMSDCRITVLLNEPSCGKGAINSTYAKASVDKEGKQSLQAYRHEAP
jgi:hypothetical protein